MSPPASTNSRYGYIAGSRLFSASSMINLRFVTFSASSVTAIISAPSCARAANRRRYSVSSIGWLSGGPTRVSPTFRLLKFYGIISVPDFSRFDPRQSGRLRYHFLQQLDPWLPLIIPNIDGDPSDIAAW